MMEENNSKKVLLSVLGVAILVVAVVGVSFAAFNYANTPNEANQINVGTITMSYSEAEAGISITDAKPTADATAKEDTTPGHYFDFTVTRKTDATVKVPYEISVIPGAAGDGETLMPTKNVKVYLTKVDTEGNETQVVAPTTLDTIIIDSNKSTLDAGTTKYVLYTVADATGAVYTGAAETYRLRMWIDENTQFTPGGSGDTLNSTLKYSYRLTVNVDAAVKPLGQ